jgi:predicted dehydrogenase
MQNLDVAILGLDAPHWPTAFADTIAEVESTTLVGFTDLGVDGELIRSNLGMGPDEYADHVDVPDLGDLDATLDTADAVLVCTRNTRMPDVIVDALRADRHVFAAKPIGVDLDDLAAIENAHSAGTVLTGGQTGRADPAIGTMLDIVDEGRIGEVRTMRVMHQHGKTHDWTAGTWYTDPEEGGPCNWLGWYPLDVATAVLGPVADVWGHAQQLVDAPDPQPDHLKATTRHRDGRLSTLEVYSDVDMDWNVAMLEAEIVGSDGVVRYSAPGDTVRLHHDGGVDEVPFTSKETLQIDIERWADACVGRGEAVLSAEDALHIAAAGCAWNSAAREGDRQASVGLTPE